MDSLNFYRTLIMKLPPEKLTILNTIVERLSAVAGVKAVVLAGSYARGTQRESSDIDVAMYYIESEPFLIEDIRHVATEISAESIPDVTDFYDWGPWVNGGAWIHTPAGKVDFLYRNFDQVHARSTTPFGVSFTMISTSSPLSGFTVSFTWPRRMFACRCTTPRAISPA